MTTDAPTQEAPSDIPTQEATADAPTQENTEPTPAESPFASRGEVLSEIIDFKNQDSDVANWLSQNVAFPQITDEDDEATRERKIAELLRVFETVQEFQQQQQGMEKEDTRFFFFKDKDRYTFQTENGLDLVNIMATNQSGEFVGTKRGFFRSMSFDDNDAHNVIKMAQMKGWETLELHGSKKNKEKLWKAAMLNGMDVQGYTPSPKELEWLNQLDRETGVTQTAEAPEAPEALDNKEQLQDLHAEHEGLEAHYNEPEIENPGGTKNIHDLKSADKAGWTKEERQDLRNLTKIGKEQESIRNEIQKLEEKEEALNSETPKYGDDIAQLKEDHETLNGISDITYNNMKKGEPSSLEDSKAIRNALKSKEYGNAFNIASRDIKGVDADKPSIGDTSPKVEASKISTPKKEAPSPSSPS